MLQKQVMVRKYVWTGTNLQNQRTYQGRCRAAILRGWLRDDTKDKDDGVMALRCSAFSHEGENIKTEKKRGFLISLQFWACTTCCICRCASTTSSNTRGSSTVCTSSRCWSPVTASPVRWCTCGTARPSDNAWCSCTGWTNTTRSWVARWASFPVHTVTPLTPKSRGQRVRQPFWIHQAAMWWFCGEEQPHAWFVGGHLTPEVERKTHFAGWKWQRGHFTQGSVFKHWQRRVFADLLKKRPDTVGVASPA